MLTSDTAFPPPPPSLQIRLEDSLATLDVELTAIKEYQENSEVYEQTVRVLCAGAEWYRGFRRDARLTDVLSGHELW